MCPLLRALLWGLPWPQEVSPWVIHHRTTHRMAAAQAAQGHWLRSSGMCRVLPHPTQPSPLSALSSLQLQDRRLTTASDPHPALSWGWRGWVLTSSRAACEGPKGCRPQGKPQSLPISQIHSFRSPSCKTNQNVKSSLLCGWTTYDFYSPFYFSTSLYIPKFLQWIFYNARNLF